MLCIADEQALKAPVDMLYWVRTTLSLSTGMSVLLEVARFVATVRM